MHHNATHGQYKTKTYASYRAMLQRATDENHNGAEYYSEKGIKVFEDWLQPGAGGVFAFIRDMGERPEGTTLDRIDPNGDYTPDNCRWAEPSLQAYNQGKRVHNTSGKTGVSWNKEKSRWEAYISKDKKTIKLGYFKTLEEAIRVRQDAELEYYGYTKE